MYEMRVEVPELLDFGQRHGDIFSPKEGTYQLTE